MKNLARPVGHSTSLARLHGVKFWAQYYIAGPVVFQVFRYLGSEAGKHTFVSVRGATVYLTKLDSDLGGAFRPFCLNFDELERSAL